MCLSPSLRRLDLIIIRYEPKLTLGVEIDWVKFGFDAEVARNLLARHPHDLVRARHDRPRQGALHTVAGNDHAVLFVRTPHFKKLSRQTIL